MITIQKLIIKIYKKTIKKNITIISTQERVRERKKIIIINKKKESVTIYLLYLNYKIIRLKSDIKSLKSLCHSGRNYNYNNNNTV
jgi:hypothetical protein